MKLKLGLEIANSSIKSKSDRLEDNYLNTLKVIPAGIRRTYDGGDTRQEYRIGRLENETTQYIIGDPLGSSLGSGDRTRYGSEGFKRAAQFAIAAHVAEGKKERVRVVTGVPGTHYNDESVKETIKNSMLGSYTVTLNGITKTFEVDEVFVELQPLGTQYFMTFNDKGQFRDEHARRFAYAKKLFVDIGWGTTDVAALDGFDLISAEGINTAMNSVYKMIDKAITSNNPEAMGMIKNLQLDAIARKSMLEKQEPLVPVKTRDIHFGNYREEALRVVTQEIISEVKGKGYSFEDYDYVVFTGGGTLAMEEYLKSEISLDHVAIVENAQMANAYGFETYARFI